MRPVLPGRSTVPPRRACGGRAVLPHAAILLSLFLPLRGAAQGTVAQAGTTDRGHPTSVPHVRVERRAGAIVLDGRLDDAAWQRAEAARDFTQLDPNEGKPATQPTEVRFLTDDDALWIGARMYDSLGAAGVRTRLGRRDEYLEGSDWLELILDTYHDHLGRTFFYVNPSGVKIDEGVAQPYADPSWDAVWEVETSIDSLGWTAEFRIPFSQLRFARDSVQTWGLQIWRRVSRLNEIQMWSAWRKRDPGGPAFFGHLTDMRVGRNTRGVEILPYVVGRSAYIRPATGDPFNRPREYEYRVGGDVKYRLTSNLTLDATINPDFGQVEVDPAVVNLTAYETFFEERRPFFIEGSGLFGFGGLNCFFCSNVSSLSLFYSRRIGRPPQRGLGDYTFYDAPTSATILGAAKITGRLRNGTSVGLLNAVTRREEARVMRSDTFSVATVEPLSNYFVGRVKRDLRGGDLVVGAMATSVIRRLDDPVLETLLPRHAEGAGADMLWTWGKKTYSLWIQTALSHVAGDSAAILSRQLSSARFFQRPDRRGSPGALFTDALDSGATSLTGYGTYTRLAKDNGEWLWEAQANVRSPGFETNDIAFLTRADYAWMNANLFRQLTTPTRWYRQLFTGGGGQQQYNYDGDRTDAQVHFYIGGQLLNYWDVSTFYIRRFENYDDRMTRGGPVVKALPFHLWAVNLDTDRRRPLWFDAGAELLTQPGGFYSNNLSVGANIRPSSRISLRVGPSVSVRTNGQQFVRAVTDPAVDARWADRRVVFASLHETQLSMNTRLNVTFTPTLTLSLFAQPLLAGLDYRDFKEFAAPRTASMRVYGRDAGTIRDTMNTPGNDIGCPSAGSCYAIDPDGADPAAPFVLENPDFNLRSLRGNAVLRWEYRPGSTMYVVWTQQREHVAADIGDFAFSRDRRALFSAHPDNVFLVKVSYWLGR